MNESLYDRLGGFKFLRRIISDFYDRVLENDDLSPYFENTDMAHLIDHQTQFFAMLLGGPASYTDEQLRNIHLRLGIKGHHFNLVVDLLVDTLEDHELEQEHIDAIVAALEARRSSIVVGEEPQ